MLHSLVANGQIPSQKAAEGFPNERDLGPHPHHVPKYCPSVDTLSVTQQGKCKGASWLSYSGQKKRFQFTASLRLRKVKLKSSGSQKGAMTFSPVFLLKVAMSINKK